MALFTAPGKLFSVLFLFLLLFNPAKGQTTYTWQGVSGASWATSTNWNPTRTTPAATDIIQFNTAGTMVVTAVPTQTIKQLLISGGADVQLQSAAAAQTLSVAGAASTINISVANGSTLELSSTGTNQLTLAFATTATQFANISGTLIINANTAFTNAFNTTFTTCVTTVPAGGVITNNGGVVTGSLAALQMQAGAVYNHAMNGGVIPTATWNATSMVNVTGSVATYPTGLGQTFGDFVWVNAGQTGVGPMAAAITVTDTLTINSGTLNTSTLGITAANTLVNGGILGISGATATKALGAVTINGGSINITAAATVTATSLNIISGTWSSATTAAAVTISGDVTNAGTITNSVATTYSIAGNFTNNGSITSSTGVYTFTGNGKSFAGSNAFTITTLTVSATGNYTNSNTGGMTVGTLSITAAGVLSLNNNLAINTLVTVGGTLNCGTSFVTGAGGFTISSGGFLSLGDPNGLSTTAATGNIQVTGTRTITGPANYTYNGTAAQVTGNELASAGITSLTVNNAAGVSLTASTTIAGTAVTSLTLTNGALSIGAFTLTLDGGITETSGSLTGGTTSNLTITGATATATTIPAISGGLNNLTLSKTVATVFTLANGTGLALNGNLAISASNTLTDGGGANNVALSVAGATVTNSGTLTLSGTGGSDLTINGSVAQTLTLGTATVLNLNINSTSTVTLAGALAGVTNLNVNTGTLTTSTLAVTVTGATTVAGTLSISGATGAKALGAVTINGGSINITAAATVTATSLNIISGTWSSATTAAAVTISGDVTNAGTITNSVATTYSIAGNFTNNGSITSSTGVYTFTGNGKSFAGSNAFTITTLTVSATGNYTNSNTGGMTVGTLSITAAGVLSLNDNLAINTLVTVGGTLNCGTSFVTGAGGFTISSGGFLSLGDPNGLSTTAATGNIQVTGTRTITGPANYTYNGTAAQVTGNELASAGITSLTVNNAAGVSLTASTTIAGTAVTSLTLTNGALSIGAFTLTLDGGITETSGSLTGGTTSNLTITGATATATTIPAISGGLNNFTLSKTAVTTITLGSALTLAGNLVVNATYNTLADAGYTTSVNGNATVAGVESGTGEILLTGGGATHTISGTGFNNLELNDATNNASLSAAATIGGALILTNGTLTIGALTLTLNGTVSGSGTLTGSTTSALTLAGAVGGNLGTLNFTTGAGQNLSTLTVDRTGTSPSATLGTGLTITGLALTSGVFNIGSNTLIYNSNTIPPAGSATSYIGMLGSSGTSGGFQWHMASVAAGTSKIPVGPSGTVTGYRPMQLITSATTTGATVLFNFINHDGSPTQEATNVPTTGNNRVNYIANVDITGTLPQLTSLTMEYLASDFNAGTPVASTVAIYEQNGTSWVKVGQTSNGTDGSNTTIVQATVNLSGNTPLVLGVEGGNDLPGTSAYVWNGSVSTAWNNPNNWTPNTSYPQTSTDNAVIATATNQPVLSTAITVNSLTVNSGCTLTLAGLALSVNGGITNSGNIISTTAGSTISMVGSTAQTISGSGAWTTGLGSTNLLNLVINDAAGVSLNSNLTIQTGLTLTNGALGGTGTLTIGAATAAVTTTVTTGSLTNVPNFITYTSAAPYNITYNGATAVSTGNELPATTETYGTLSVSVSATVVTLSANANVGSLSTVSGATFNLNGNTLGLALLTAISNTGTINASASSSTLLFNGSVAQNFAVAGTYTGSLISNLTIANTSTGVTLGTTGLNVGYLTVQPSSIFILAGLNISVKNDITNSGTINSTTAGSTVTMSGSVAQNINGAGSWTTGTTGRLLNMVVNNTSGVNLNVNLAVQTGLTLTAGALGGTGALTIGIPATAVSLTLTAGSLSNAPAFGYTTGAYTINYNGGAAINTGYEMPPLPTPTNGPVNITVASTNVTLSASANVGSVSTAASTTLNLNGDTLGLSLLTSVSNTGTITANATTSALLFNGAVAQNFALAGTYTGSLVSNVIDANTSTGVTLGTTGINVGYLAVQPSSILLLGGLNLNIKNDINNAGTINTTTAASTISMNGTVAQNINGTGVWTTGTTGRLLNLVINNAAGVSLNTNLAVQTSLLLTAGILGGSGTLTIGIPATAVGVTRTAGSLASVPSFGYTTGAYAITYNSTSTTNYNVLNELPVSTTPTNGVLTVSTATSTVTLDKNANIGSLTTSVAGATFNVNGFSLGLSASGAVMANTGTFTANSLSTGTVILNGTAAQTLTIAGTYTGATIPNLTVSGTVGATIATSTTVNNLLTLSSGTLTVSASTLTLTGTVTGSGFLTGSGASVLTMTSSAGSGFGTINMPAAGGTFGTFNVNITGSTPSVTITGGNLTISTAFTLTSGIIYMGNSLVTYTGAAASMATTNVSSGNSYFACLGGTGGFQWNMAAIAAGTYQWPVGPNGVVAGCRPVLLTTAAAVTSDVEVGFINHDGSANVSGTNVLNDAGDTRANFIANITASAAVSANITLSYTNGDFNNAYSGSPNPTVFDFAGSGWATAATGTPGSANGVSTIKTTSAFAIAAGTNPFIPATTITTTGSSTWTWEGTTSTNWAVATNWSPASIPNASTANVIINNPTAPHQPSTTAAEAVNNITIGSGCTLTLGAFNLTVSGAFTNNGGQFGVNATTSASTVTYAGTGQTIAPINYYNLGVTGTSPILSPTGIIGIVNTFTPTAIAFTYTGSTMSFYGAAQSVPAFAYFNNVVFHASSTNTLAGAITVYGNLTDSTALSDAAYAITGNATGTFAIAPAKTFTSTYTNANPIPLFATYSFDPTSTYSLNAVATQNIDNSTSGVPVFGNLSFSAGTANTKTIIAATTVAGNLTIAATNTIADGGNPIYVYGNVTNNGTHSGAGKISVTNGSAVHSITSAAAATFGNLELNDNTYLASFSNTASTTAVSGMLTVTSGTLNVASFTSSLTVTGGTNVTGTLNLASATGSKNLGSVTINSGGVVKDSIAPVLTVANLNNSGTWNNTANGAVAVTGTLTNNGTFNSGTAAYTFSGTGQSITTTNGSPLTITSAIISGTNNATSGFTSSNLLTISTFSLSVAASTFANNGVMVTTAVTDAGTGANAFSNNDTLTIGSTITGAGAFTNTATGTLYFNGASIGLTGTWTSTAAGNTVVYSGSGAQSVKSTTYSNLTVGTSSPLTTPTATAAGAITISNTFTVNSGTFSDGTSTAASYAITGNGTGQFNIEPGAIYNTWHAAAPFMPTLYTTPNVYLDPASTFNYISTTAGTITATPNNTATVTAYGNVGIGGAVAKTLGTPISVTGLNISASATSLVDAGYQITGPGTSGGSTGSNTFNMVAGAIFTSTNTNNSNATGYSGPMPLFATYAFAPTSTVNYNAAAAQNIYNIPSPGYGNLTLDAASASVKSLLGGTYVQGTVTTSTTNNTVNLNGDTLYISGATPLANTGVLTGNATGSTIELNGTATQTFTLAGTYTGSLLSNLVIANTSASGVLLNSASYNVAELTINTGSLLNLNAKTLNISDQYANNGTLTGNAASSTIVLNSTTGAQAFTVGTYTGSALYNFTINNTGGGVTLNAPLNVSGVFNLTAGLLSTTSTNLLTVTNTAVGGVTGGSTTSYVSGPLARNFTTSSTGTNLFPVGASIYNLFQFNNPVVSSGTVTVTAQVFDANAGGSPGAGMSALNTNRYWSVALSGTGTLSSVGSVALNETTPALVSNSSAISQATSLTGTYAYKGGTVASTTITSTAGISPALGYFVIGTKGTNLCPGPYVIGPTGDFLTISDVANLLNGVTMSCNLLFQLQPTYTSSSEVFPINFQNITNTGNYTLTFRPNSSVSSMLTTSGTATTGPVINLNDITYLTFDGRPGGTGTTSYWTVQNTTSGSSYPAIQFINGSADDTLEYMTVLSSGTNTTGNIVFSTSTVTGGNSYNTVKYCNIGNYSTLPYDLIYSLGTAANPNSNNNIVNNSFYNFQGYTAGSPTPTNGGVIITGTGNGINWKINNNSFYANTTTSGSYITCIDFEPGTASTGDSIYGNYIGGQSAMCGGSPWNFQGYRGYTSYTDFTGIYANAVAPVVSYNTIQNIKLGYAGSSQTFSGITMNIASGQTATLSYNTIGSTTTANSIHGGSYGEMVGIYNESAGAVKIDHNIISNLTSDGSNSPTSTTTGGLCGIYVSGNSANSITNNTISNLTTTTNYNNDYLYFGVSPSGGGSNTTAGGNVTESLVAQNMTVTGIYLPSILNSSTQTISENTIYGLTTTLTGSAYRNAISGIVSNASGTGSTININGNTIYGLYGPNTFGSTTATDYLELTGVYIGNTAAATYTVTNNMIDLGYKTSDGSTVTNSSIRGIWDNSDYNNTSLKMYFYHNSVYIGGSDNTALNSYAFSRDFDYTSTVYDSVRLENNIFYNNRSSTGTGKQYGIYLGEYNGTIDAASDYNIIYGTGTNFENGNTGNGSTNIDYTTLASWTSATGFDAHSIASDPIYILPNATSSPYTPNLRINTGTPTPVEGLGTPAYTITYDIDSNLRASYTPVDIGADAGNFLSLLKLTSLTSSTAVCQGSSFSISCTVTGAGPVTYQWYHNSAAISGASGVIAGSDSALTFSLSSAQFTDSGSYFLIVSHTGGADTSNTATLHVNQSPVISVQPVSSQTIALGSPFTVSVTASPATSYQWQKNGVNISGATASSYTISSVALTDSAASPGYTCIITSGGCSTTSSAGILVVAAPSVVFDNYNSVTNNQITFNNAYIGTTSPIFSLTGSYALGNITAYRIDISTSSTFATTNWTQTFAGTYASGSQNDFTFTNASGLANGTTYYVRALASDNGGTTYGPASSGTWSFTYKSAATAVEWRQQMTPQFATWTVNSGVSNASNLITVTTAPTNQVTDPCLATGTDWNEYVYNDAIVDWAYGYGQTLYDADGPSYPTNITGSCSSTGILVARNWNSNYVSGNSYSLFAQPLNLTGVSTMSIDFQLRTVNTSSSSTFALGKIDFAVELGGSSGSTGGLMSGTSVTDGGTEVENIQSPATPTLTTATTNGTLSFSVPSALQTSNVYLKLIEYNPSSSNASLTYSSTYGGSYVELDIDNINALPSSVGTFTTVPAYLSSFVGASTWGTLNWGQTLNGGTDTFTIQTSADGITWTNATGLTNITSSSTTGSQDISSAGNAAMIRVVGRMNYGTSSPSISYLDITTKNGPVITYTPLPNTNSTANPAAISATITESGGTINTTSGTAPRIYYKKVSDSNNSYVTTGTPNSSSNTGWKWVEQTSGSPFSMQIDYSKLYGGSASVGDLIEYFVVAQDASSVVGINEGSFNAVPSSVADYAGIFPITGAINKYWILPSAGTYYVGTTGNFPSLTSQYGVFQALDSTTLTGNVTIKVTSALYEDGTYALNQWKETGAGGYTVQIVPTDTTASGTVYPIYRVSGTNDMIRFDNACSNATSKFVMDGQKSGDGIKHFRFRNTNSANATMSFLNDAQNVRISNSYIESANANTYTSGTTTSSSVGTVFFSNAKTSGVGNRNDTISYSSLEDAAGSIPANDIWSYNTTSGTTNYNIAVLNNTFYNFSQCGVYATATGNGPDWMIANNSFYNPSDFASYETAVPQQIAIYLAGSTSSYSDTISGNTIGGSASGNSGTWVNSSSALDFEGIRMDLGGSTGQTTLVSNNVIKNINLTGSGFSNFMGIRVKNGPVDIISNRIGDLTGNTTTSIQVAGNGTDGAGDDNMSEIYGIWNYSTSASNINYDTVAGITNSNPYAYLTAIRRGAREYGSNALNQPAGQSNVGNNLVANLASNTALSSVFLSGSNIDEIWPAALTGIASISNFQSGTTVNTYHDNVIYNLNAYGTWNRWVRVYGMALNGDPANPVNNGKVYNNKISNLTNYNGGVAGVDVYTPEITGIELGFLYSTNSFTVYNNMIALQPTYYSGNSYNDVSVYGILDDADNAHSNVNKFYYNTILIGGTNLPAGGNSSFALLRYGSGTGSTNGGTDTIEDNILINERTGGNGSLNGTSPSVHYAVGNGTTSPSTGWNFSDYNFYASASTSAVGYWNGTTENYTNWKSVQPSGSVQDADSRYAQTTTGNSQYVGSNPATAKVNPGAGYLFIDPTDIVTPLDFLHLSFTDSSNYFVRRAGKALNNAYADITTDIDGNIRSTGGAPTDGPTLGAHEAPADVALPVQLIYLEAYPVNNVYIQLAWATDIEINNRQFNIERSTDGVNWTQIDSVPGHGNTTTETTYNYNDKDVVADVRYYYRLKQIDFNGNFIYTDVVTAILTGETQFTVVSLAPNPAMSKTSITMVTPGAQEVNIDFYDMLGQRIVAGAYQLTPGVNQIDFDVSRLSAGTYSVIITTASQKVSKKLIVTR